jgi:hypothetical protein
VKKWLDLLFKHGIDKRLFFDPFGEEGMDPVAGEDGGR